MSAASAKGKAKEKPFASLLAGATAGGIESFVTFPLESLKTQLQFGALNGEKVSLAFASQTKPEASAHSSSSERCADASAYRTYHCV